MNEEKKERIIELIVKSPIIDNHKELYLNIFHQYGVERIIFGISLGTVLWYDSLMEEKSI